MTITRRISRAFTIIELVLSMLIIAIIAGVVAPVTISATDAYAKARTLREASENAAFAIDRVTRILHEAPAGVATRLDVLTATPTTLIFTDSHGLRLNGHTLEMMTPDGAFPIARSVSAFEIRYIDDDGISLAVPNANAHRLHVTLQVGPVTLSAVIFPSVNLGGDG